MLFCKGMERKRGLRGRGVVFGFQLPSSAHPTSLSLVSTAPLKTLFSLEPLEAPGCACNKTPCLLLGPSTSLHSSDNSSPVLLTLASFPCSFQSFLCTRQLSLAILLWHPIPPQACPLGTALHARPRHGFRSPKVGGYKGVK